MYDETDREGQRNYDDPELLTINTLENAIYMSMQNDLSFVIDSRLSLYEHQSTYSPNLPVDRAIDECIREGILKEFLERNRAEARAMSIYEYDQEEHIRLEREDAFEDGSKAHLISQIQKKLAKHKSVEVIADELEETVEVIQGIVDELKKV